MTGWKIHHEWVDVFPISKLADFTVRHVSLREGTSLDIRCFFVFPVYSGKKEQHEQWTFFERNKWCGREKKTFPSFLFYQSIIGNSNYRAVRSNQPEDFVVPEMAWNVIHPWRLTAGTCPHVGLVQIIFLAKWVICRFQLGSRTLRQIA